MKKINSESGRTMLEMLGVLGIMGIIMYGAVSGINYGMSTYKINQVYNDVQDQMQGITDLYSWAREYPENMTATVCENDIFSQECVDNQGRHVFGGTITVTRKENYSNFLLTYTGIPQSACERLKEMEWGNITLGTHDCTENATTDMSWSW